MLDVGCGTGNLARAVAERWPGCEVVGVDPSAPFVEAARERAGGRGGRVRFELGDAGDLPLDDGSVDAALALLVLTFVPDAERAVAEMRAGHPARRACSAAAVWDYGRRDEMLRTLWDAAARLDPTVVGQDEATMPLGRPGGLIDLWQRSGLDDVDGSRVRRVDRASPTSTTTGSRSCRARGRRVSTCQGCRMPPARRCAPSSPDLGPGPFELSATAWWVRGIVPPREA